jgi:hypothetical protein
LDLKLLAVSFSLPSHFSSHHGEWLQIIMAESQFRGKHRSWCFTLNNFTADDIRVLEAQFADVDCRMKYLLFGEERGEGGTPHLQGYVVFEGPVRFNTAKARLLPRVHLEPARGNFKSNYNYCTKDGVVHEFGTKPAQGKRNDLAEVVDMIKDKKSMKEIIEANPSFQAVRMAQVCAPYFEERRDWKTHVSWYWGATGTGKTRRAHFELPDAYIKTSSTGKWWDGYDGEEDVILDDLRPNHFNFTELLHLFDRYGHRVQFKGGSRNFIARRLGS